MNNKIIEAIIVVFAENIPKKYERFSHFLISFPSLLYCSFVIIINRQSFPQIRLSK